MLGACASHTPTPQPTPAATAALATLESAIRARIAAADSATVAVSIIDLANGRELHINGDSVMHAASTMKVPVLLELYRRAEQEPGFSLDKRIAVSNMFKSIADTSHYSLDAGDDSDSSVYKLVGDSASLRYLARRMIVRSSNLATNILIDVLTPEAIRATVARAGATGMNVLRGVEDGPAYRKGMNNTTTSFGLARTLAAIARCTVTSRAACQEMIAILADQEFNEMIPAGLPAGTKVAHKTGWITRVQHDGAIVFPAGRAPYVLVVLTKGISDTSVAAKLGADISRVVWQTLTAATWAMAGTGLQGASADLAGLHARNLVSAISARTFTHAEYWNAVAPYMSAPLAREEIGRSAEGRPIYLVRYGTGPTRVLLWSQMHGDESTATMALADLMRYLRIVSDSRTQQWAERLTILMVPMLNPDGAEWFVRHDALGIDVNRDARVLSTPEARILKGVRDRYQPQFGFNLHDQNARTRVGNTSSLAAIALLAPPTDSSGKPNATMLRAMHVAALIRNTIEPFVGGHITKYDDAFNPRAFGDLMQRWGTSTVLIESGGWRNDPQKQYLRRVNFAALVAAFDGMASGDYAKSDIADYESLLTNGAAANDLLIRGGTIVVPGFEPYRADIAANINERAGSAADARIVEIGDLAGVQARDTVDATGLYVHPAAASLQRRDNSTNGRLLAGSVASFTITRDSTLAQPVYFVERGIVRKAELINSR